MPKVIPPPPPQPSLEETKAAMRFTWGTLLAFALVFWAISTGYHRDAPMVDYGRDSTHAWNVLKAHNLDMNKEREHPGGRIIWLIGSSIIRESFDEEKINLELLAQQSPYRVIKLAVDRGAAGISFGLLKHADIQPGDQILHHISLDHFKKDWLEYIEIPAHQIMELYEPSDFWDLQEWRVAEKLEQASAIPSNFYAYHEDVMNGYTRWWVYLWYGESPPKRVPGYRTKFIMKESKNGQPTGPSHYAYIAADGLNFSAGHINQIGLAKFKALSQELDAELILINIPSQQKMMAENIHQDAIKQWKQWSSSKDITYFPQQAETDYYDLIHPNFRGRRALSQYLVEWITSEERKKGSAPVVTWPIPDYNK